MFLFEESAPEVLYKYYKKGIELPRFYTPLNERGLDMDGIYLKMLEAWTKYNSRIFFIDHLHYLLDDSKESPTFKIKKVVQDLKQFAKQLNFTIFLVAHIKHQNNDEPPGVEAIRDSSFVAQYADTTLMLWRETYKSGAKEHKNLTNYTNNLLINVALNRKINFKTDRNTGLVDLTFNTDTWSYEESNWYKQWVEKGTEEDELTKRVLNKIRK
jgi:replicative DNA helicase